MSWFNKKKEQTQRQETPQLPELPELPELPKIQGAFQTNPLSNLPSSKEFEPTESPPQLKFNFPLTKEISSGKEEVERGLNEQNEASESNGFYERPIGIKSKPRALELEPEPMQRLPKIEREKTTNPVFVRIDKYQEAVHAFQEIKSQLNEIENYLREVRSLKQREESELANWESQIESIKARLSQIDQGVFGKLS